MSADDRRIYEDEAPVRKRSSSSCLPWLFGFGIFSVICGVLCCGGLAYFGLNMMATEVEVAIRDNAQIREHLGDLQSVRLNFMKSIADNDDNRWVYEVTGSKGKGELSVVQTTGDDGGEVFHSAKLRLADGKVIDVQIAPEVDLLQKLNAELDQAVEKAEGVNADTPPTTTESPAPATVTSPPEPAQPE